MPKIVDHEQYRKELLGKCFHLFAQKGYASITMRQLAEGVGVSTGTLYHYFPSKQAIFEQMMLERVENSIRQFDSTMGTLQTLREKVLAAFHHFKTEEKEAFDELILYVEFHQHQQREGQENHIVRQIFDRLVPEATCLLGIDDPRVIQFLFSIVDGLLIARVYGQVVDWDGQAELVSTMLESYLTQLPHLSAHEIPQQSTPHKPPNKSLVDRS
jgi:AcrR family transcriptional regulator